MLCAPSAQADLTRDWAQCQAQGLASPRGNAPVTDAPSQYCRGLAALADHSTPHDPSEAPAWWAKAAAQGHAGAEVALGYSYEKGRGVAADPARALALYRQSAAQNNGDGLFNLGRAYRQGIGVPPDEGEAQRYFKLAAAHGSEDARIALLAPAPGSSPGQALFDQGAARYRAKDYAQAMQLFMQAASAGNLRAQLQVGSQYEQGEGVARNDAEAVRWYTMAARGGDAQAMKNLGLMLEEGRGTREDWPQALRWYRASADRGDAAGEFALGRMYEFGMAVPQSRAEAIAWFRKSAARGNSQAAYFARWLADPTNNIGFRNEAEHQLVIADRLRYAGDLIGADPAGLSFVDSRQRTAWLQGLRQRVDHTEAQTRWQLRRSDYEACTRNGGSPCVNPGPAPR